MAGSFQILKCDWLQYTTKRLRRILVGCSSFRQSSSRKFQYLVKKRGHAPPLGTRSEFACLTPRGRALCALRSAFMLLPKQIGFLKQQNRKLRDGRDLLLPRLMSGKIAG